MSALETATLPFSPVSRSAVAVADLGELLRHWSARRPGRVAYTFLGDDDRQEQRTYGQLHQRAVEIAGYLQQQANPSDRVLLLFPAGLEFVEAFFGSLYAGLIPVPTCYPKPNRPMPRLSSIAGDSAAAMILSTSDTLGQMDVSNSREGWADLPRVATNSIAPNWSYKWQRPAISSDDVAFLQYTSGSTSDPKGVMVSHGNLLANLEAIRRGFQVYVDENDEAAQCRGVFWLPAYHDMGLIGAILTPLYVGGQSYLMSPRLFLQRPLRWLDALSRTRASISGAPNFAFDLCVEKTTPQQRAALDLSHWEVAFCGAEPIRAETLDRFAEAFAVSQFRREAFYPCYGLAESTLLVAGGDGPTAPVMRQLPRSGEANGAALWLVGCGRAAHQQHIEIVDPETLTACAPGQVGEIWVQGPSNALGYWNRPEDTQQTFAARLADTGEGPYLRTGDLGFISAGQLYITGRMKDMIIIRGRNHYPQDIEWSAGEAHEALQPNAGAAFAVEIVGGESVVVVHEVARTHRDKDLTAVVRAIRRELVQQQEIDPWAIVLLRPGGLPRTTSGKVQRSLCKKQYFDGRLRVLQEWTNPSQRPRARVNGVASTNGRGASSHGKPRPISLAGGASRVAERIEAWLLRWLVERAGVPQAEVSRERPFAEYGLDSLTAVELSHDLENWLDVELTPVVAWNYPTPARLSDYLARQAIGERTSEPNSAALAGGIRNVGEFERLLAEIEKMSDDQARQCLGGAGQGDKER